MPCIKSETPTFPVIDVSLDKKLGSTKGCFIDSDRIDTVLISKMIEEENKKPYSQTLSKTKHICNKYLASKDK